ncbi:hypothetical protein [Chryseobacterium sp.]|uniref:hypothetical protein n=1 Tax=Chryseobacterium sp. TaxID=1871047 RepID=UPI001AD14FB5|nr:hypothetical protein [Chryseobacterium sp.]MBN9314094.1 hypothetical protein [Chryseobacterium sp.]
MDIQTRKLEFIQEFLKVQSEDLISRLERILNKKEDEFKPFSLEELNSRIDKSLDDSKHDRITESTNLLSEIEQWQ